MTVEVTPLLIDSSYLTDRKKDIREKIIPWEGLARAGVISEDDANHIKILEKQSIENKNSTIISELELYTNTILNLLSKLGVNSRDEVLKNVLVLINDFLLDLPNQEFTDSLLKLSQLDETLPFEPFLKHLENSNVDIKILSLYNLTILLHKANKLNQKISPEVLIKIFDTLSSSELIANTKDTNLQYIGIQLLQELIIPKSYKTVYLENNLITNFKPINELIAKSSKSPNSSGLQLLYNTLLTTWILSFSAEVNKVLVHNYPEIIGNLLTIAKDSIKLKVVRMAVSILKNFIAVVNSGNEKFKTVKLVLFHDGLNSIKVLQDRKFASNSSDEELSNDLAYLNDSLTEVVQNKLTSLDEYLTELENPNLLSWSSPTHKSSDFWLENSHKFKESSFKLVKKMLNVLDSSPKSLPKNIMLNDLQFLIQNLGNDLVTFINQEKNGQYRLMIMNLLENNDGDSELKYQALKTIQLLVGHNF